MTNHPNEPNDCPIVDCAECGAIVTTRQAKEVEDLKREFGPMRVVAKYSWGEFHLSIGDLVSWCI